MALRVLLADESSTIKKVFQLALQDFAVDVRPVNVGLDVLPVAASFKPDIVFADVLLQKKSGYEVSAELKQSPELGGIPVVLMWSGFMELDEDKFQASHANAQLEKPFDVSTLRKLVTELVPRTQNQRLSQFLSFPPMPEIEEGTKRGKEPPPPPEPGQEADAARVPPEEDFKQISIPRMKGAQAEKFRVNLAPGELDNDHMPVNYQEPPEKIDVAGLLEKDGIEEEDFAIRETKRAPSAAAPTRPAPSRAAEHEAIELDQDAAEPPPAHAAHAPKSASPGPTAPALSAEQLERIVRQQSAEVIESVVWKVVPDLAAQIIERELQRLLKERDGLNY